MMDDDAPPTAEEQAEAEALARALEPPGAPGDAPERPAPEDALATAALLRHARATASESARAPATAAARAVAALAARRPPRARRLVRTVLLSAGAMAMVLVLYLVMRTTTERTARLGPATLPAPTVELLRTQARAARGGEDLGALDRDMRAYRAAFYAALATREGGGR
jgi:hypothetical protein